MAREWLRLRKFEETVSERAQTAYPPEVVHILAFSTQVSSLVDECLGSNTSFDGVRRRCERRNYVSGGVGAYSSEAERGLGDTFYSVPPTGLRDAPRALESHQPWCVPPCASFPEK